MRQQERRKWMRRFFAILLVSDFLPASAFQLTTLALGLAAIFDAALFSRFSR